MERTGTEDAVHLTVLFRDKSMPICMQKQCSVRELGEELVQRTGVVPHTMRLILLSSKRTSAEALSPFAERFSSSSLEQTGVHEVIKFVVCSRLNIHMRAERLYL